LQNEKRQGNGGTLRIESLKPEAYLKSVHVLQENNHCSLKHIYMYTHTYIHYILYAKCRVFNVEAGASKG
jgi:hypothetical protein